ncbi:hypothetical protein NE237_020393 [Protea cynaroides]|uniref:Secreted protein n=1 Tax=Protea cynaroides TaxID=273540 RepID=A0A9Q0K3U9_9MAGN|nr:hypothetical protein NE237_020393 [Protea cynaroides]
MLIVLGLGPSVVNWLGLATVLLSCANRFDATTGEEVNLMEIITITCPVGSGLISDGRRCEFSVRSKSSSLSTVRNENPKEGFAVKCDGERGEEKQQRRLHTSVIF